VHIVYVRQLSDVPAGVLLDYELAPAHAPRLEEPGGVEMIFIDHDFLEEGVTDVHLIRVIDDEEVAVLDVEVEAVEGSEEVLNTPGPREADDEEKGDISITFDGAKRAVVKIADTELGEEVPYLAGIDLDVVTAGRHELVFGHPLGHLLGAEKMLMVGFRDGPARGGDNPIFADAVNFIKGGIDVVQGGKVLYDLAADTTLKLMVAEGEGGNGPDEVTAFPALAGKVNAGKGRNVNGMGGPDDDGLVTGGANGEYGLEGGAEPFEDVVAVCVRPGLGVAGRTCDKMVGIAVLCHAY